MADVFTGASTDAAGGQLANQVLTAYDRVAWFQLRSNVVFDQLFNVKPGNLSTPGSPVTWRLWDEMAPATTPLNEITSPDSVGFADSAISVTPAEYGNVVKVTLRIKNDNYLIGFESDIANLLGYNMVDTIDTLARTAADASGTEVTVAASEGATVAGDVITAALVRQQAAALASASVMPASGTNFAAIIHPDVAYDLKSETGDGAWVAPSQYVNPANIYNNEIGTFANFKFMESPRATLTPDGGSTTVDTYTTYFCGKDSLAKVDSISPHMVLGPVTDALMRVQPLGWHTYAGWGQFRVEAMRRLISASSIGANV